VTQEENAAADPAGPVATGSPAAVTPGGSGDPGERPGVPAEPEDSAGGTPGPVSQATASPAGPPGEPSEAEDGELDVPDATPSALGAAGSPELAQLELESEIAADYVEGLLDAADLDGDIDMDVEGDRALVSVVGATLEELVGPRGEVLEALQELTRLAVQRQTGNRTRLMLDIGGYRQQRRADLTEEGREAAEEVKRTGMVKKLPPMTPFERKIVHDAVAAAGLRSESEGEEPERCVVVHPVD
jgi:spoIIIJ-associated protein